MTEPAMRMRLLTAIASACLFCCSAGVYANLQVKFVESAPKDWFAVTNLTNCDLKNVRMSIELSNSAGKLIFDTTASGAGVEVFQPFEVRSGEIALTSSDRVFVNQAAHQFIEQPIQLVDSARALMVYRLCQ